MLKILELPDGFLESVFFFFFLESIFKAQAREWSPRVCAQLGHTFLVDGEITGQCHFINPQAPVGLGTMCSWSSKVNLFCLAEVLASVKQLRKCAANTVVSVLQRGTEAEDRGRLCPSKAA